MYSKSLVGVSLIMMLTACGSDSGSDADNRQFKGLNFTGTVHTGAAADTEVSIFAGEKLLATTKTDEHGKYSVNAKIYDDEYDDIKSAPITYKAHRDDLVLYEYAEKTLEQALANKENDAFLNSFSTVEYVLADTDKNDFVSLSEWGAYQTHFEQSQKEKLLVRYGVGLKAIADFKGSLTGFNNSTIWLRNTRSDVAWHEWIRLNDIPYSKAWTALFKDAALLNRESDNFVDIHHWEGKKDQAVEPDPTPVTLQYVVLTGLPKIANVGDLVELTPYAQWSNGTSSDLSADLSLDDVTLNVTPEGAAEKQGLRWRVKQPGLITFELNYQGNLATASLHVDGVALENIVLSNIDKRVSVGDVIQPIVSATWSDRNTTEVSGETTWSVSPADAAKVIGQNIEILKAGDIVFEARYQGATSKFTVTAEKAELTALRLTATNRIQYLEDTFKISAEGIHDNGLILDFTNEVEWTSSNPEILEVQEKGHFLAKGIGVAIVTATHNDFSATYEIEVEPKLTALSLNLHNNSVSRNQTVQLSLNGEFNDGSVTEIIEGVTWASSDSTVLTIDELGQATGVVEGAVTVTATYDGLTLEEEVTVTQAKITASTPTFDNGDVILTEGQHMPYGFKFTRENGVSYEFTHLGEKPDYIFNRIRPTQDASAIEIAKLEKDLEKYVGVRAGTTQIQLGQVSVEMQQILHELGAIERVATSPTNVDLDLQVLENQDIYQWHKLAGNSTHLEEQSHVQSVQYGDTVYRFWGKDTLYVTKLTSTGESEAVKVEIPHAKFRLFDNKVQSGANGYVTLLTSNERDNDAEVQRDRVYRYNLIDGTLAEVDLTPFYRQFIDESIDSFQVAPNGNVIWANRTPKGVKISVFDFEKGSWLKDVALLAGERVQFPTQSDLLVTLDNKKTFGHLTPPVLSAYNLATGEVTTQALTYPVSAEYNCSNPEAVSVALRGNDLSQAAAGCLIADPGSHEHLGYWVWNKLSEPPHAVLLEGKRTNPNYPVAFIKPDGHVAFSTGRRKVGEQTVYSIAEVIRETIEGVEVEKAKETVIEEATNELNGRFSTIDVIDGQQFVVKHPVVENEAFVLLSKGALVLGADGQWNKDRYLYQLPIQVDGTTELFNLGDTIILARQGAKDQTYWQLQLREPIAVEPPVEEPAAEPAK